MKARFTVHGNLFEFEGTPLEIATVARELTASVRPVHQAHIQTAPKARKKRVRFDNQRDHQRRYSDDERRERVLSFLRAVRDNPAEFATGPMLAQLLEIPVQGLGGIIKDLRTMLESVSLETDDVIPITGVNPKYYRRGPCLGEAIDGLTPKPAIVRSGGFGVP